MPNDRTNPARRRALGTTVIACALVAVALGAPTGVLTLLDDGHPPTTDHQMPESLSEDRDSVAAPQDGATPEAGPSDGGRWGAAPERPTSGGLRVEELRGGWRVQAGAEEAAALGVLAAHAWASGDPGRIEQGTGSGGMGRGSMAGDAVAVTLEAVERPGLSHAVVTVLVAHADDVHRLAIPIVFRDSGPALAGEPWRLPSPSTAPVTLEGAATGDEVLIAAARDALERAGIPGARMVQLEVTDGWPFIARLDGEADGHPWLRWHLDRFVVAGLPLDRAVEGP
jgi:hypothetical protein